MVVYIPKLFLAIFMMIEDVGRIGYLFTRLAQKILPLDPPTDYWPDRRAFISKVAIGIAAVPFIGVIDGIFRGRYNFEVIRRSVSFPDLPTAFEGFKIIQISDVHSGSFDKREKIEYAISLINDQKADMICFTGDMVNTFATEMDQWVDVFKKIDVPLKYSVLGNHDYGDYAQWKKPEDKVANFEKVKQHHADIGFNLLLNEHRAIEKDGERIHIAGVENWGAGRFQKYGDLNKTLEGLPSDAFTVLMSHDPSHWDAQIVDHPQHVHLTLSGHTHGMQFGIKIPGISWSPVQYVYKRWMGLYETKQQRLYVNRGFGYLAVPMRVGMWPEITVLELTSKAT